MNLSGVFINLLNLEKRRSLFKPFQHAVQASDVARGTMVCSYPRKYVRVPAGDAVILKFLSCYSCDLVEAIVYSKS